jgi:hypothetical protein
VKKILTLPSFSTFFIAYLLWAFLGLFGAHVSHTRFIYFILSILYILTLSYLCYCISLSLLISLQRFYIGRPASGIVWLLTGGLFGIGWIIDFFLIPDFV